MNSEHTTFTIQWRRWCQSFRMQNLENFKAKGHGGKTSSKYFSRNEELHFICLGSTYNQTPSNGARWVQTSAWAQGWVWTRFSSYDFPSTVQMFLFGRRICYWTITIISIYISPCLHMTLSTLPILAVYRTRAKYESTKKYPSSPQVSL